MFSDLRDGRLVFTGSEHCAAPLVSVDRLSGSQARRAAVVAGTFAKQCGRAFQLDAAGSSFTPFDSNLKWAKFPCYLTSILFKVIVMTQMNGFVVHGQAVIL